MDTEKPSFTNPAACFLLAGVIRCKAPISSSLPQRPQLDRSFFQRSYCASVTVWAGAGVTACDDSLPAASANISNTNKLPAKALIVTPLACHSIWSDQLLHLSLTTARCSACPP